MTKVLFVTEKWADANPNMPITNSQHNLFGSLEASGLADYECIHYDEYFHTHHKPIDEFLVQKVIETHPDITIFCLLPHPTTYNPRNVTYEAIAKHTKIVFVWPDATYEYIVKMADEVAPYTSLSVMWDCDKTWYPGTKFLHLWTPQDPRIYYNANLVRDINVSFTGCPDYPDRKMYLQDLPIYITGGRKNAYKDINDYANILQRSKIVLNFSRSVDGYPQLKGRVFEVMSCGAMLMESSNDINWIDRWYIPDLHYVSFSNVTELKEKIQYYLVHEEDRVRIAQNGCRKTLECYNNVTWWMRVFQEAGVDSSTFVR